MATFQFPRESVELVRLDVAVDGAPTTSFTVSCSPLGGRPTGWQTPDEVDGHHGYLTGQLAPGMWQLWIRVVDNPEQPVRPAAVLQID